MTSLNINLELFEKYQTIGKCIRYNGKESEKLKINIYKHELVYSANAYRRRWVARNAMHKIAKKHSSYPSRLKKSNVRVISRSMSFYARIGMVILTWACPLWHSSHWELWGIGVAVLGSGRSRGDWGVAGSHFPGPCTRTAGPPGARTKGRTFA